MAFHQYLSVPDVVDLKGTDKRIALRQLAQTMCRAQNIKRQKPIIDEMLRKEEAASTFIGQGIAIPQTRGPVRGDFAIAVGRSVEGIKYDAARGALAHIIVLVMSRETGPAKAPVELLSEIAAFFKSATVSESLLATTGPVEILDLVSAHTKGPGLVEEKDDRTARRSVDPIISCAVSLAKDLHASALVLFADAVAGDDFLLSLRTRRRVIVMASNKSRFQAEDKRITDVIQVPPYPASRTGQIKIGLLLAISRGLINRTDRVVCICGNSSGGVFDTVVVVDVRREFDFFFTTTNAILPPEVKPEVLERVLGLASEIAVEGREGKPIGTIFVLGDTNSVGVYVRQLIINPFRGYSEAERNILDPGLDETIKEFAGIDGAFVVTGDGVVLSAGSYLKPQAEIGSLPSGFGTRHAAAAGITACTNALAVTISESTGMVTIFKNGAIMLTISRPLVRGNGATLAEVAAVGATEE